MTEEQLKSNTLDNPELKTNGAVGYSSIDTFLKRVKEKNPGEIEFFEAVKEVIDSVWELLEKHPKYLHSNILERLTEPERVIMFRVPWTDDKGHVHINRGYRVEFNSAIGPYKGGLRFHPSVNLDILKFLAFEQTFKNSLTTLPIGGAKGGADFDPKGKSDSEVMRFCQSFMTELYRYIGPETDIPAGDIGVGRREIGYLFGQYKRLSNEFNGVMTGKSAESGGSLLRPEATGYGLVYFVSEMLQAQGKNLKGQTITISGSGNVAQFAAEKSLHLGGKVVSLSDSDGTIYDPKGLDEEKLAFVKHLKNEKRGRIREYAKKYDVTYLENQTPWNIPCDIALPCATENEIDEQDAIALVENGCWCVAEGANKPCQPGAVQVFLENELLFGPGKAANAGGVAVSQLEMAQNSMHTQWSRAEVDSKLQEIMRNIHSKCITHGETDGNINYIKGANIAGFLKVADAMLQQGFV
ncbi:NADP-specific glutamate dehydrogenase [Aliifodinibius sp. S!AR15-10]|uniref:NADP-specific glutamate dehydrogenase n=1 Tax=Aliifodinibius sp. S!AR15-10 TaxID=2950437 RepID=UPI0028651353|nr:NADP-specific glutamate dehydrogenase [Aliifodinibius sp. S!AR15-10]MDR8390697.1 NADP-specific glutamate dehydrogenase [Aliifodinibius sp. S!AR15-10]